MTALRTPLHVSSSSIDLPVARDQNTNTTP